VKLITNKNLYKGWQRRIKGTTGRRKVSRLKVGMPNSIGSGSLPCEVSWELDFSMGFVCVAPLRLEGLRGEKSTPSVGWEVLVRYSRLTSGELEERDLRCSTHRMIFYFFFCKI
jgi:hypothetical protein